MSKAEEKTAKRSRIKKSVSLLVILCLAALFVGAAGMTMAFLTAQTSEVENVFTPGKIVPHVDEVFDGNDKSSVKIANTVDGNVKAYIRVAVIANNLKLEPESTEIIGAFLHEDYKEEDGKWIKTGDTHPIEDYLNGSDGTKTKGWIKYNGYYYYTQAVEPNSATDELLAATIPIYKTHTIKEERKQDVVEVLYNHQVTILAEAIQADGKTEDGTPAVVDAWGVDPSTLGN